MRVISAVKIERRAGSHFLPAGEGVWARPLMDWSSAALAIKIAHVGTLLLPRDIRFTAVAAAKVNGRLRAVVHPGSMHLLEPISKKRR